MSKHTSRKNKHNPENQGERGREGRVQDKAHRVREQEATSRIGKREMSKKREEREGRAQNKAHRVRDQEAKARVGKRGGERTHIKEKEAQKPKKREEQEGRAKSTRRDPNTTRA